MMEFLNKMHYGLFHFQLVMDSKLNSILLKITPKKKERVVQAKINETESFMESFHMGLVNHCFGYCYAAYFSFFSFILLWVMKIYFHIEDTTLELVIFAIPIVIGYIPMYRSVFMNDRYLCFYKDFKKKMFNGIKNGKGLQCFFVLEDSWLWL